MAKYRNKLPQLSGGVYLTDGGIETDLIFNRGMNLPHFAAFTLLKKKEGLEALRNYFRAYAELAKEYETGLILESATWRASTAWGQQLRYSSEALAEANREAIRMLGEFRLAYETEKTPVVLSGCVGPRGDGYSPDHLMTAEEATDYHLVQINAFALTDADLVTAMTMNYVEEAIGVARAARSLGMPVVISFTVETDGNLPAGQTLPAAIESVDNATMRAPEYYMINCAHPIHFEKVLQSGGEWTKRLSGLRSAYFALSG